MTIENATPTVDLDALIRLYDLNTQKLQSLLFPTHKHPYNALYNVRKGVSLLDSDQLRRLAEHIGVPVDSLYDYNAALCSEDGLVFFKTGSYRATVQSTEPGKFCVRLLHKEMLLSQLCEVAEDFDARAHIQRIHTQIQNHANNE